MVEASPMCASAIKKYFKGVILTCNKIIIFDFEGHVGLFEKGPSTFIDTLLSSPHYITNDDTDVEIEIPSKEESVKFPPIDEEMIDIEGADWFVIKI